MTNQTIPPCPACGATATQSDKDSYLVIPKCKCITALRLSKLCSWVSLCDRELLTALRDLGIETVAQVRELKETRDAAVEVIANWVDAIDRNGGGWDGWDRHYKDAKYGDIPIRALVDEALRRRAAEGEK